MRAEQDKAAASIRTQDAATDWSMKGKTVLFTGASRGMGRFAALELARLGAEILIVGHNQARGVAAVEAIRGTGGSAQFLHADMADAAEVCALAADVLARSGPVHVLIHSAGGLPALPRLHRPAAHRRRGRGMGHAVPARPIAGRPPSHPSAVRWRQHALRLAHLPPRGHGRQRP